MSLSDDDDLDGILDSALDNFEFDDVDTTTTTATPSSNAKGVPGATTGPTNENLHANGNANGTANTGASGTEEAALRAFREALSAPLPSAGEAAEEEMDMQLVEQFMKSLESLHSSVPPNTSGSDANGNGNNTNTDPGGGENFIKALIDDFLSKDVLIEPITQVKEGIGAYLESHPDDTTADGERYRRQHGIASELVDELEEAARPQRIIELLAALKECGKFPDGIIDGLPDPSSLEEEGDMGEIGADIAAMTEACKLQ